jgi:hypothetical protein
MKFDPKTLRNLSEQSRPQVEEETRRRLAEAQARALAEKQEKEAAQLAAEEETFNVIVQELQEQAHKAAQEGKTSLIIGDGLKFSQPVSFHTSFHADHINIKRSRWFGYPKYIIPWALTRLGQRVYYYCVQSGFKTSIEFQGDPKDPHIPIYRIVIKW